MRVRHYCSRMGSCHIRRFDDWWYSTIAHRSWFPPHTHDCRLDAGAHLGPPLLAPHLLPNGLTRNSRRARQASFRNLNRAACRQECPRVPGFVRQWLQYITWARLETLWRWSDAMNAATTQATGVIQVRSRPSKDCPPTGTGGGGPNSSGTASTTDTDYVVHRPICGSRA